MFYERLLYHFDSELQGLLDYLDIRLGENDRQAIKKEVSVSSMRKSDPFHVYKGIYGGWLQVLTKKQKKEILKIAGPLIDFLNYSTNGKIDFRHSLNRIPAVPKNINDKQIRRILSRSNRPTLFETAEWFHKIATLK